MTELMPPPRRIAPEDSQTEMLALGRAWITADDLVRIVPAVPMVDHAELAREISAAVDDVIMDLRGERNPVHRPNREVAAWLGTVAKKAEALVAALAASPLLDAPHARRSVAARAWFAGDKLNVLLNARMLDAMRTVLVNPPLAGMPPLPEWGRVLRAFSELVREAETAHRQRLRRGAPQSDAPRRFAFALDRAFLARWPSRRKGAGAFIGRIAALARERIRKQLPDGAELARALHSVPDQPSRARARKRERSAQQEKARAGKGLASPGNVPSRAHFSAPRTSTKRERTRVIP